MKIQNHDLVEIKRLF